jgi:DNA-directed RNA polymerase subunit L
MHLTKERGLELSVKHPGVAALVAELAMFFKESGAENFVEMTCYHPDTGHLNVTIQRVQGKTPATIINELRAKIAEMEKAFNESVTSQPVFN